VIYFLNKDQHLGNIISYEKQFDIDNELHNYLKITGILNDVFRLQEKKNPRENKNKIIQYTGPPSVVIW
jgi:hypothetical protein